MLNRDNFTNCEFSKLLGVPEAALPGVGYGHFYLFHSKKNTKKALKVTNSFYDSYFSFTKQVVEELTWWKSNLNISYNSINNSLPTFTDFSDAYPNGWGIACGNESYRGHWTNSEINLHTIGLELATGAYALKIYCGNMLNIIIYLKIVNMSALAWINK